MRDRSIRYYAKVVRNVLLLLLFCFILFVCQIKSLQEQEITNKILKSGVEYLFSLPDNAANELNKSEIRRVIYNHNEDDIIMNEDIYGTIRQNTVIIVLIVDKYSAELKFMLFSLSQVKGIQDALLIFSHSNYNENADALIKKIDFCRVLQIYYPHSLQLHPDEFPGTSPGDCPPDMDITEAESINCTGASSWDIHGHYRSPQLSQKKHHWWWTANKLFENLKSTEGHTGTVVFIEDNYFFLEDFLYMVLYMKNTANTISGCEFLALSSSNENEDGQVQHAVEVVSWDPALYSDVLAFDLAAWNSIVSHFDLFCEIDDNSWSQSLSYVSFNRRDGERYRVMASMFPRAYPLSKCLNYGKFLGCNIYSSVHQIISLQHRNKMELFPPNLEVFVDIELEDEYLGFDVVNSNGGWNDSRDKDLCKNMTVNKIKKLLLEMNNQFDDYKTLDL